MVWDPDCVFYCMSLQYYCAGYCIHLLTGSCINKITNKTNLSKTSYLQIIAGQNVLGQNVRWPKRPRFELLWAELIL